MKQSLDCPQEKGFSQSSAILGRGIQLSGFLFFIVGGGFLFCFFFSYHKGDSESTG